MDFDLLKERYRAIPTWGRCPLAAVLTILPSLYLLLTESNKLDIELTTLQEEQSAVQRDFDRSRKQKNDLPAEEQQLASYEENLRAVRRMLPDDFSIDEILQATATKAAENSVRLQLFDPAEESRDLPEHRIRLRTVAMRANGNFAQIATFFDQMLHLDKLIHIEKIQMSRMAESIRPGEVTPTVECSAEMIVYASM